MSLASASPASPTVAAAQDFSVAVAGDGALWTWGTGSKALGLGPSTVSTNRPAQIGIETTWTAISATDNHCLALRSDGSLWTWGDNWYGQLGLGDPDDRDIPTQVGSGTTWAQIAAADGFSAAIRQDGSLWTWGDNAAGQLGLGHEQATNLPARVGTGTNWTLISASVSHCLGTRSDGSLWAWGNNFSGALGLGHNTNTCVPLQVGADTNWVAIAARDNYSLALRSDGSLWSWGRNWSGELGLGNIDATNLPARVGWGTNWVTLAAGRGEHSLALQSDGSLWAWGNNVRGQCGQGYASGALFAPTRIGTGTNWVGIAAGENHSLALCTDGSLWACGGNDDDALGTDTPSLGGTLTLRRVLRSRWRTPSGTLPSGRIVGLDGHLNFGEIPLTQSAQRTFNIFNDGDAALHIASISHSAPQFSGSVVATIAPGDFAPATITCSPTAIGDFSGTLTVQSDATGGEPALTETATGGLALDIATDTPDHAWSTPDDPP